MLENDKQITEYRKSAKKIMEYIERLNFDNLQMQAKIDNNNMQIAAWEQAILTIKNKAKKLEINQLRLGE